MNTRILTKSDILPIVVDEGTVKYIKNNTHWGDYEFNCPCCEEKLIMNSLLLTTDEDNESEWVGNCPCCKVKIRMYRPD
jgi:hypothetical protein